MRKYLFLLLVPALIFSKTKDKDNFLNDRKFFLDLSVYSIPFTENKMPLLPPSFSLAYQIPVKDKREIVKEISFEYTLGAIAFAYMDNRYEYAYSRNTKFRNRIRRQILEKSWYELKYQKVRYTNPFGSYSPYYGAGLGISYPRLLPAYLTYGIEWNRNSKNPSRLNMCFSFIPLVLAYEANPSYHGISIMGSTLQNSKYLFTSGTTSLKIGYGFGF